MYDPEERNAFIAEDQKRRIFPKTSAEAFGMAIHAGEVAARIGPSNPSFQYFCDEQTKMFAIAEALEAQEAQDMLNISN